MQFVLLPILCILIDVYYCCASTNNGRPLGRWYSYNNHKMIKNNYSRLSPKADNKKARCTGLHKLCLDHSETHKYHHVKAHDGKVHVFKGGKKKVSWSEHHYVPDRLAKVRK
ncbi:uncharacterized protein [Battus philenor]|uniref:uncharacterized protein isoform X2 n=1 Tax=Battus philenor TaxID=42288 RepID=UPI0035CED2E9